MENTRKRVLQSPSPHVPTQPWTDSKLLLDMNHRQHHKKLALKRSVGLLNLSLEKETYRGVTKSFNDLNFDSPFMAQDSVHDQSVSVANDSLNDKLRHALNEDKENIVPLTYDNPLNYDTQHLQNHPQSPIDSPSKPLRPPKQRFNASHIFRSNKLAINTSTPIENKSTFITPSSYKSVKPLQTAFQSSTGLMSKKNASTIQINKTMPDTPCKKPSHHIFTDHSTIAKPPTSRNTLVLQTTLQNFTDDFDSPDHHPSPSSSLSSSSKYPSIFNNSPSKTPSRKKKFISSLLGSKDPKTPVEPVFPNTTMDTDNNSMISFSNNSTLHTDLSSFILPTNKSDDDYLISKFDNVQLIGKGEFSIVYSIEFEKTKYAVKRTKNQLTGPKTRLRKYEEVEILKKLQENQHQDYEGHEYILNFIDSWEFNSNLYIMTEFCENGSLDKFLIENGKIARLDEWRVWKILIEILIGLRFLHNNDILHLDLKPANIFITFEGSLKIGDFGLLTSLPIPDFFEREGDREYIAPEVISHQKYDKPADIFSVGLMLVEILANIILPDNGVSWQKLRSGDLTDAGKLSSTDLASYTCSNPSNPSSYSSYSDPLDKSKMKEIPSWAPIFLTNGKGTLDSLVHWMINPNPNSRPSLDLILSSLECQFVESRRKCGSVIYEGEFGPEPNQQDRLQENQLGHLKNLLDIISGIN